MALVKYGGGVIQASGSIAGTTHARNRFGNYIRARTKPVNPRSTGQGKVRTAMSFLTNQWSATLTAGERAAWATYAAAIAMKNRLGETVYMTGFNHFVRSNVEFYRHNTAVTKTGPTVLSLPEKDIAFAVSGGVAAQKLYVEFTEGTGWALEVNAMLLVYMGQPRPATRNFFAGPWKYIGQVAGVGAPGAQSPTLFDPPYVLILGQLVTCYARIRRADGRISEPFTSTFTVTA